MLVKVNIVDGNGAYNIEVNVMAHNLLCLLQVFSTVDPSLSVTWTAKDGDHVTSGTRFGTVKGSARSILIAERIALNFTQRMSGIATATAAMVEHMKAGACSYMLTPEAQQVIRGKHSSPCSLCCMRVAA